jgi:hypothetical protein
MPSALPLLPRQREALAQALADAVSYRDPPVCCAACDALGDTLCDQCAATFARARTYLELSREIGIEVST